MWSHEYMSHEPTWLDVWRRVADELDEHRVAGLELLLTEDVVRFATVRALVAGGTDPRTIRAEWRPRTGQAVDLALGDPVTCAIEFKFPREPVETNAAWTQHLGEVLKDFYRLSSLPRTVEKRWCVQVISTRLGRYLDGVAERTGVRIAMKAGASTALDADAARSLPQTAQRVLGSFVEGGHTVRAACVDAHQIGGGLRLVTHLVEPSVAVVSM